MTDRSLFWMEPHVVIQRSFDDLQRVCQALLPGASGRSWRVPALPSGPQPAQQPPAHSCPRPLIPEDAGKEQAARGGEELERCEPAPGHNLGPLSPFPPAPSPSITKCSRDRCKSSRRRGKVTESFGFNVTMHTCCVACHVTACLAVT